ncbi:alpha/beta hydrolase [Amycolatopsis samaneae]|uniref:Acyl-CoA:diacylglycerol acyltransferase n=1 Tax=Amycolatopsis samaneae TaxID=664691 RepID=A0ABW5GYI8_9PSEU
MTSSPRENTGPDRISGLSRRGLLLGGAATLLAAGCSSGSTPVVGPPASSAPAGPAPLTSPVTVERVRSKARGKDVDLVLVTPEGVPATGLPVCLALHGRGASARTFLELGLPEALNRLVKEGARPFAVAAVDGDNYWVNLGGGDDPQRMLSEELPEWIARHGLRPVSAALGISMGGFGALRYARDHHDLAAVAVCSAALFLSWPDARSRKVFADQRQWEDNEPLLHTDDLAGARTGVWCGSSDPFVTAGRRLIKAVQPAGGKISPGTHGDGYWREIMPDVLRFVGERMT